MATSVLGYLLRHGFVLRHGENEANVLASGTDVASEAFEDDRLVFSSNDASGVTAAVLTTAADGNNSNGIVSVFTRRRPCWKALAYEPVRDRFVAVLEMLTHSSPINDKFERESVLVTDFDFKGVHPCVESGEGKLWKSKSMLSEYEGGF